MEIYRCACDVPRTALGDKAKKKMQRKTQQTPNETQPRWAREAIKSAHNNVKWVTTKASQPRQLSITLLTLRGCCRGTKGEDTTLSLMTVLGLALPAFWVVCSFYYEFIGAHANKSPVRSSWRKGTRFRRREGAGEQGEHSAKLRRCAHQLCCSALFPSSYL